jgi:Eco29kI restriction endonuclease
VAGYYDPMAPENITQDICRELECQPLVALRPDFPAFPGAGLYAIYYLGGGERLYAPLAPGVIPVYVGRSFRHDGATGSPAKSADSLYLRIRGHARSIEEGGLTLGGFRVRLLVMADVHTKLGEQGMRSRYQPIWNTILTGFDGDERGPSSLGSVRKWHTVHCGRRIHGAGTYDRDKLIKQARAHIAHQVATVGEGRRAT